MGTIAAVGGRGFVGSIAIGIVDLITRGNALSDAPGIAVGVVGFVTVGSVLREALGIAIGIVDLVAVGGMTVDIFKWSTFTCSSLCSLVRKLC
jgi:hypothetical protein